MFILFGSSQTKMKVPQRRSQTTLQKNNDASSIYAQKMCQKFTRLLPNKKNRSPTSLKMDSFQPA